MTAWLDAPPADAATMPIGMRQIPLDFGGERVPTLDDFRAAEDDPALRWLRAWPHVEGPLSPVYLWGPSGSGKTHVLRAMSQRALDLGMGVIWLNAHTCQMWEAADAQTPSIAFLDECEQLDAQHQHLAFKLFIESAAAQAGQGSVPPLFVFAAGRVPSVDLPVRDDLRTRLGWGLSFSLTPLDDDGVREVLQQDARRRGMTLSNEVVSYLLTRYSRNLAYLMQLLDRLDHFALAEQRVVTVPLLKSMVALENP